MEENFSKQTFPEISVFTCVKLKSYLDENLTDENSSIFITGKFFEHTTHKYNFKACEFYLFHPFKNKMFYSVMNSDECFTNSLKWNTNFFKKIRNCFIDSEMLKNTNFVIAYDKEENNEIKVTELNDADDFEMNQLNEKKFFFEIYFLVEGKEITAFRLLLKNLIDDKPYITLMNKLFEYEKFEDEKLMHKQKILNEKENDLNKLENQIKTTEEAFIEKKTDFLAKFYLLLEEKDKKIESLK
jgi:hypothetical protein